MNKNLTQSFDLNDPELISIIDDLPLWSAPFGQTLLDMVRYRPDMNVLDIGCGLGFPMIELAQRLGASSTVYGIDPWGGALERVKLKIRKLSLTNITIMLAKAEKLPFGDRFFDLIVSNNGLNNVENIDAALSECRRVIKAGGRMILTMNLPDTMKEFYDVYRAVLKDLGKPAELEKIDAHIYTKRKPLREIEDMLARAGFSVAGIRQDAFTMKFADGTALFNHFLIKLVFLRPWLDILQAGDVPEVFGRIEVQLNELSRKKGELILNIPFVGIECKG